MLSPLGLWCPVAAAGGEAWPAWLLATKTQVRREVGSKRVTSSDGVVACEDSPAHTAWDMAAGHSNTMEGTANLSGAWGGATEGKRVFGGQWESARQERAVEAGGTASAKAWRGRRSSGTPCTRRCCAHSVHTSAGGRPRPGREGCLPWRAEPLFLSIGHPLSSRPLTPGPEQPPGLGEASARVQGSLQGPHGTE